MQRAIKLIGKSYLLRLKGVGFLLHVFTVAQVVVLLLSLSNNSGESFYQVLVRCFFQVNALALVNVLVLRLVYSPIRRMSLGLGALVTISIVGIVTMFTTVLSITLLNGRLDSLVPLSDDPLSMARNAAALAMVATVAVLHAFVASRRARHAQQKGQSNRLKALQARMRPHFFFNTLNSVATLIRTDPEAAERIIEDLADIFRAVMKSTPAMVSVAADIELTKQYLEIEKLRLGERLNVEWNTEPGALDAHLPSLTLQPLVENAVYHGIEPNFGEGTITIDCSCEDERLHIMISNPLPEFQSNHREGNKIALRTMTERLKRHFRGNVNIRVIDKLGRFHVMIDAPLVRST